MFQGTIKEPVLWNQINLHLRPRSNLEYQSATTNWRTSSWFSPDTWNAFFGRLVETGHQNILRATRGIPSLFLASGLPGLLLDGLQGTEKQARQFLLDSLLEFITVSATLSWNSTSCAQSTTGTHFIRNCQLWIRTDKTRGLFSWFKCWWGQSLPHMCLLRKWMWAFIELLLHLDTWYELCQSL